MVSITEKTLQDLQFPTVLETISGMCNTQLGAEKALIIKPYHSKNALMSSLLMTSEYLSSFINNNAIPNHGFEQLSAELKFLAIEDSYLDTPSFKKISNLSETVNVLLVFFKKFHDYYPQHLLLS